MRQFSLAGLAACLLLGGCATDPRQTSQMLVQDDPKFQSSGCQAARTGAQGYNDRTGERLAAGAAIGAIAGPAGLPLAAALDAKKNEDRKALNDSLFRDCITVVNTPAARPAGLKNAEPDWLSAPTADQIMKFYPAGARLAKKPGDVLLGCRVALSGDLKNCGVITETPQGYGFGEAALKLTPTMKLTPKLVDGEPFADAAVTIPIQFRILRKQRSRPAS